MRNYLHLLLLFLSINLVAQIDDDCFTAQGSPLVLGTGTLVNLDNTGFSEEADYLVGDFVQTISGYLAFTWTGGDGFFSLNATGVATGEWNISISEDCDFSTSTSLYQGLLDPGSATEISCMYLEAGDYIIGYSTDFGNEGVLMLDFINSSSPPVANALCDGATDQGQIISNCTANNITGDLAASCPSPADPICLDLGNGGPLLWYSFTTDNNAEEITIATDGSGITPQFALLEGSCGSLSVVGTCGDATFPVSTSTPYWIAVGEEFVGAGGAFGLDITASFTPTANDCGVETLTLGSLLSGTTTCASGPTTSFCAYTTNDHAVYYDFTVAGVDNVNLDIEIAGGVGVTGISATDIGIELYLASCGAVQSFSTTGTPCAALGVTTTYECVPPGDYTIAIGSQQFAAGDFDITVDQSFVGPANDACANADNTVVLTDDCTPVLFSGTTLDACPESFTGPACPYNMESVVWHEITLPVDAIGIQLSMISGAAITVFTDNVCAPSPGGFFPEADCATADVTVPNMTGGNSYLVGVSTPANSEGAYSFNITAIVPPANDLCGDAILLTDASAESGSNNCATADTPLCSLDGTTSHVVWYQYDIAGSVNTGLNVNVSADGAISPMTGVSIQLFDACSGNIIDDASAQIGGDADCSNPLGIDVEYECLAGGISVWIAVGSDDTEEGDFIITVSQVDPAPANDACADADASVVLTDDCTPVPFAGTTVNACPESFTGPACPYDTESVVWHEITLPVDAIGIQISMIAGASITVFTDNSCPTPAGIFPDADCITTDATILGMTGGNSYLVGVSAAPADEMAYSFEILAIVPPANDLCGDAILLADASAESGSNNCATADTPICALDATLSHVVWYQYDIAGSVNTGLNVNVSADGATSPMTGVSIQLFDACSGNIIDDASALAGGDADCSNPLGIDVEYECLAGGTSVWIAVGSNDTEEGDFIITVSQVDPAPINDACADADATVALTDDCTAVAFAGTTVNACPESFTGPACPYNTESVVWHEITLPADAVGIEISMIVGASITVFTDNACPTPGAPFAEADCTTTDATIMGMTGGNSFLVGVSADPAAEMAYSFEILAIVPPANDLCGDAILVTDGTAESGTNNCATADTQLCTLDGTTSHVVWYQYDISGAVNTGLIVNVSADGATSPMTGVSIQLFDACAGNIIDDASAQAGGDVDCSNPLGTDVEYECLAGGTSVWIAVGSDDTEEGDFTITVTQVEPAPANDACADADDTVILTDDCTAVAFAGTTVNACPESFTGPACPYDTESVVWHEITLPADAVGIELSMIVGASITVFTDNTCPTPAGIFPEADCITTDATILGMTGGNSFLVGVSADPAAEMPYSFEILAITPPPNDICDPDAEDISATAAAGVVGTTACATPPTVDYCGLGTTDSHVVYYEYTVASTKSTDLTIFIAGSGVVPATGIAVELYTDCVGAVYPNNVEVDGDDPCAAINTNLDYECVTPGTVLIIAVGSADGTQGEFTITVTEDNSDTPDEDACAMAIPIDLIPNCEWETVNTPNVGACPETPQLDGVSSCELDEDAVIWFEAFLPVGGIGFEFQNLDGGEYVAIFSGDCDNLVLEQDCVTADGQIVGLAEDMTYLFAVSIAGQVEGLINFDVKTLTPADNDDPCMPVTLTSGAAVTGDNTCATFDIADPNCDVDQSQSSVWFTYTLAPGETGVEISFPSITAAGPMNVWVVELDAACTTATQVTPTSTTCDAGALIDPLTLNCLDPGTVLSIMVTSESDLAGEFEIQLDVVVIDPACIDNDECSMVAGNVDSDQGEIVTDDDCALISDCNTNACAEFIGDCGVEINNVVWYSVTNDGDGEFISTTVTNAGFDAPVIAVFEGGCDAALMQIGSCVVGGGNEANTGPLEIPAPAAGQQYWIAIGTQGPVGGDFDLCIEINSGCVNDMPCDAFELDDGVLTVNPASTVSCTPDTPNPDCINGEISSVWYTFEVPAGSGRFRVALSNVTIVGNVGVAIVPGVGACDALPPADMTSCEPGDQAIDFLCAPEGSIWFIQISSGEDMDEGDFEIQITSLPPLVPNDLCSGIGPNHMIEITENEYCQFVPVNVTTEDACPEVLTDVAGCDFSVGPTVWYEVTIPDVPGANLLDITTELISGFAGNLQLAVVQTACDDFAAGVAIDCQAVGNGEIDFEDIPVTPGDTYQIIIGSDQAGDEGEIVMNVKVDVPPINDSPFMDADNAGPWDLAAAHSGTTCCAIGNTDDPTADWANLECGGASDENAVWYSFVPTGGFDGFFVNVDPTGMAISGNMTVEVYSSTTAGGVAAPNQLTVVETSCAPLSVEIAVALCDPTLVYYVKVGSTDGECGEFSIAIMERNTECAADECADAESLTTNTPTSCEDGENILSIDGCLDFACPEDVNVACMSDMGPTVWYQLNIDSDQATILLTEVVADGFDVTWSIWQSTTGSCDDMINVIDPEPAPGPNIPCGIPGLDDIYLTVPIVQDPPGTPATYWIAITALGEITDPNFVLNYAGSLGCIACSGETAIDCGNGEWTASIDGEEVEVEDFENFCPGQEVEVCVEFEYNTAGTGNDWLHGIIPTFGPGWDLESIDFPSIVLDGDVGGTWVEPDGACATVTSIYTLPNLCTYTNDDGLLQLCNTVCNTSCPCSGPLPPSSPLPGGWFWNNNGGSTTCVAGSCTPVEQYGYSGGVLVPVDVCFDLIVKAFPDEDGDGIPDEDCEMNRDLQISLQTTSDAVTGCWEDNPCIIDPSITGPAWEINCDVPAEVLGDDVEICFTETLDIDVNTDDGSAVDIVVEVIDNPNVDGETDFMFTGGNGTIDNTLTNTSSTVQIVMYEVFSVDPTKPCPGVTNTIEVTVYPEIEVTFNNPLVVCDGFSIDVIATPSGGTGIDYTFAWGAPGNETDPMINVTPSTTTTYVVTVTDNLGCTGSGEVQVFWNPPVVFNLEPTEFAVCQNDIEEELLSIDAIFLSGTAPFDITWTVDNNLDYWLGNNAGNNDVLTVYEETSVPGIYTIFVDVIDANGCENSGEIDIAIGGNPFILINDIDIPCDGGTITIGAAAFATADGPPVSIMELHTCDGIVLFDNNGSTASWTIDPNDYDCVVIVAIDQDGCEGRSDDILLDVNAGPTPTLTGDSHCIGETSMVSVDDPTLYTDFVWNTPLPDTGSSITADRDTNFIYVVTVTDSEGCTGVASFEVEVDDNPVISLAGSLSYCTGSSTTLTASGGDTYLWTQGATTISTTADVLVNTPGDIVVLVTNAAGCTSDSTITVVQDENLLVSLNTLSLCDGDMGTLSAGESPGITYQWEDDAGTDLGTTFSIEVGGGTYCVTVTDTDAGCTGSTCTTITPSISPTAEVTPFVEVCREANGLAPGVILNFNDQVIGGTSGTWVNIDNIGGNDFLDDLNAVDFTGIDRDTFKFEFRTNTAMDPCIEARDTMCVSVINCVCPSVAVDPPPSLCNSLGDMFDLNDLKNTNEDVTWTSIGANVVPVTGTMVDLSGLAAGTYEFLMTLVNPVGGTCPPDNTASFIIVEEAIVETTNDFVCNADTGNGPTTIDLNTTLSTETSTPGVWTDDSGAVVSNMFDGNLMDANTTVVFTYTATGTTPCDDISAEVTITIIDCNCPQVMIVNPDPICNDSGTVDFDDQITTTEPGTWVYVAGGTTGTVVLEAGNIFNSNDGTTQLSSGLYTFNYVLDTDPGGDCISVFPIEIIVSNQPEVSSVPATACNTVSATGLTTVDLTQQLTGDIGLGTWVAEPGSEAIDIADPANVEFDGQAIGSVWAFTFTSAAIAPCVPASATVMVTILDCSCPNVDVTPPAAVCNSDFTPLDLASLQGPMIGTGNWTVTDPLGMNVALTGTTLMVNGIDSGEYMLTYTLDPVPASDCQPDSTVILSVFAQPEVVAVEAFPCNTTSTVGLTTVDLTQQITGDIDNGTWTAEVGSEAIDISDPSNVEFDGQAIGSVWAFTFTSEANGPCLPAVVTVMVTVTNCDCPNVNIMAPADLCNSEMTPLDLTTLQDPMISNGAWTVLDPLGMNVVLDGTNLPVDDLQVGDYILTYTLDPVPAADCQPDNTVTLSVFAQPEVMVMEAFPCNTFSTAGLTTVNLEDQISGDVTGGSWAAAAGSESIDITDPTNVEFDGQAIGSMWAFTYTSEAMAPCMPAIVTVMVTVTDCDCPNINITAPADLCNSEMTPLDLSTLEDPNIGTGAWTVLDPMGMNVALSGTNLSVDGIAAGDYMLTYTLDPVPEANCVPANTVTLSVSNQVFVTLAMDLPVCIVADSGFGPSSIDFNALVIAGATDGVWTDTDGSGVDLSDLSDVSFVGIAEDMAFTFTYTATSDAPCGPASSTIVINTNACDCPLANPMDPAIECSDVGVVDLSQYNNATFPGTWSSTELTVTGNSVDLTDVDAGVYVLMYTMDNPETGCPDTWDTSIEVSNPASAGTPEEAAVFCEDDPDTVVDLAGLLTDEDAGGVWSETSSSTGGAFDASGTFDFVGQAPGTYTFIYSITGDAPCVDVSEMVEVIIEAIPDADAGTGSEIDCINTEATIGGASSTGASFTYEWTEAGGATIADPTLAQITVTSAGVYTLVVTNTETMCTNTDMVTVTVSDEVPSFMIESFDITCDGEGDGIINIINPMGGNGDYSYSFDGGPFGTETNFTGLQEGQYMIVMEDSSGSGCTYSLTGTIIEPDLLVLDLGPPVQTNIGNEVSFSIEDQLGDFDIDNIEWTVDGELICSDSTCTSITFDADQNANVNVEVTYNNGCPASAMTQVLVTQVVDVVLPNVFSPNNDGNNEVFFVNSESVESVLSMRVYDRWGELLFVSENQPPNDPTYGWNGTFKGEPLNPGVYVYVVEVLFVNGTTETIGGDITIVK